MTRLEAIVREAERRGVALPTPATVAKYGWTLLDWLLLLKAQGWQCPVCEKFPRTGRFVTDHEHVRGWKHLPAAERALYIRGLTCWTCNRYLLARGISAEVARNVARYLDAYAKRRPA